MHTTDPLDETEEKLLRQLQSITDRNVLDEFLVSAMLREQEVCACFTTGCLALAPACGI